MRTGIGHAGALGIALALALAAPAAAQEPRALTAPAYPGNTVKVETDGPIVAGSIARVKLSGHAQWEEPDEISGYTLYMYVQNGEVESECEPWYGAQLQKGINIGINATTALSGWVIDGAFNINQDPPETLGVDWADESLPFTVRPGVEKILLCLYQRYVVDDAASYQLPVEIEQPRCRARRSTVTRGRRLRLKCNVSGEVSVRFRGKRSRKVAGELRSKDGSGSVSTRRLRPGRYRVTVWAGTLKLGRAFTVRVR